MARAPTPFADGPKPSHPSLRVFLLTWEVATATLGREFHELHVFSPPPLPRTAYTLVGRWFVIRNRRRPNVQATEELCEDLVPVTDKHLLGQFLAGDDAAFTRLSKGTQGWCVPSVTRVLRNPSDCDDAFQATFIILASRAKSLTWHDSIGGWLHQVARRVSVRLRADLARRRIAEQDSVADQSSEDTDPLHQVGVRELGEILDCELAKLPERFRDVILLTQAEGLSRSEAATRLGISVAAVKDRLERGRELLQSRLIKRGLTLSSATLAAWLVPNSANAASIPTLVANTGQMAVAFTSGKLIGTPLSVSATLLKGS